MTDTASPTREALDRRQQIWARQPDLHYDEVTRQAALELAAEAEQQAAVDAKTKELSDSLARMMACPIPGCDGNTLGSRDGLCGSHSRTAYLIQLEREAARVVNGHTQRALVEAWLDR